MNRTCVPGFVIVAAGLATAGIVTQAARAAMNEPADVQAIKAVEQGWANAQTVDEVLAFYAPDALVFDGFYPGVYRGTKEIREGFAPQYATVKSLKAKLYGLNIVTNGPLACAFSQQRADVQLTDGKSTRVSYRQTDVLRKIDGEWRIVQQHVAYPFNFKTGMGYLDAAPVDTAPMKWSGDLFPGPSVPVEQAKAEIRQWTDNAANAQNMSDIMGLFGPGDDIMVYDVSIPGVYRGRQGAFDGWLPEVNFSSIQATLRIVAIETDGLFGAQSSTQDMVIKLRDGSVVKQTALRQTDCLHKVDGKWYSYHDQLSLPVDMTTGKVVSNQPEPAAKP